MNFITTCTSRKTLPCPAGLSLQSIAANSVQKRFSAWLERLSCDKSETKKPIELYSGGSWKIVRRINSEFSGKLKTWVVSAGQGLLAEEEKVPSYAATFASGEPDCVVSGKVSSDNLTDWWTLLCEWRRANGKVISSLADLAHAYPNQPMVVALSADYFKATQSDLLKARAALSNPDLLVIISAGTNSSGELANNLVPADARLENVFGKSRIVLNARVAEMVLRQFKSGEIRASKVASYLGELIRGLPPSTYPKRESASDNEVSAFISKKLHLSPCSCSRLLQEYRATGRACEQKRFRNLYHNIRSIKLSKVA
jgi:hypothetical protein